MAISIEKQDKEYFKVTRNGVFNQKESFSISDLIEILIKKGILSMEDLG